MHRGVREFIQWVRDRNGTEEVAVHGPANAKQVTALEHQIGSPLPVDLKLVLGVFDGGTLPNGVLLSAQPGPGETIESGLRALAEDADASFLDPDLLLPFHLTEEGSYLAFDRSAAPVSDTWPIVDYYVESGERRLIHRTFDGWCRLCVAEWTAADYKDEFSVEKYLAMGERHARIEPDVSIAHVTVAHGLRRAGKPDLAMESYLRAARCVPAVTWADWEALKLAVVLRYPADVLEAGARLGKRAPQLTWEERGTTPSRVAYALARRAPVPGDAQEPWLRILDGLCAQAVDEDDEMAVKAIRTALVRGGELPPPSTAHRAELEIGDDLEAGWLAALEAYRDGSLREEDLVLDDRFEVFEPSYDLADILRVKRDF